MADTFKKYEAIMAQKRQRKTEKKQIKQGQRKTFATKIERLSAQVKGTSQKYARMGPLKRVDVLEDDLFKKASIDVIRRACVAGFNVSDMTCDILETERGPSIESLDEIKNLNGALFVRFINQTFTDSDNDDQMLDFPAPIAPRAKKPRKPTPVLSSPQKGTNLSNESKTSSFSKPVAKSLSVTAMLRLGRVIKPKKETMIQV